jgi:UDP:flavonoid glycosyltransferase YjiC (YdhE family)
VRVLLCPLSSPGYLYPATAVALELQRRSHDVALFTAGQAARAATAAGVAVLPAVTERDPHAFDVSRWFRVGESQYRVVRSAAQAVRPDVVVTSVLAPGALLAAEALGLPAVVIGLACHLWPHRTPAEGPEADAEASDTEDRRWRLAQTLKHHQDLRRRIGLPPHSRGDAVRHLRGRALLLRGHPRLEPKGAELPDGVRHIGPLWWEPPAGTAEQKARDALDRRLDQAGKPVVYIHLGRTFGGESLWEWIDAAFTGTGHQAVVELGRTEPREPAPESDVLAIRRPAMAHLLRRAEAVVSNGTSAPVLGALLHSRPLLLRPNGGEQRLLSAACLRAGVAVPLDISRPAAAGPGSAASLDALLADARLRCRARSFGAALAQTKSAALAAQEVEDAGR